MIVIVLLSEAIQGSVPFLLEELRMSSRCKLASSGSSRASISVECARCDEKEILKEHHYDEFQEKKAPIC